MGLRGGFDIVTLGDLLCVGRYDQRGCGVGGVGESDVLDAVCGCPVGKMASSRDNSAVVVVSSVSLFNV